MLYESLITSGIAIALVYFGTEILTRQDAVPLVSLVPIGHLLGRGDLSDEEWALVGPLLPSEGI